MMMEKGNFHTIKWLDHRHSRDRRRLHLHSPRLRGGVNGGVNCIIHTVSKFDTLAGVAIKYGVEVADIKRLNGLVTDLQMFALKTLQIPLPGRHPPSPTCPVVKILLPAKQLSADPIQPEDFAKSSPVSNPPLSQHRKSKSVALLLENDDLMDQVSLQEAESSDSDKWIEKLVRRRQKSEADFTARTPEKLLKEDNTNSSAISAITGKNLALRPKSANRTVSGGVDGALNPIPIGLGDSFITDMVGGVRKSSSTSCLQDPDNGTLSSLWPTSRWSLKPDFQALSTSAITRPIFDGLPKPMTRRNKAALD
ncbi:hypothetical protein Sango_1127700 [Sesamum angolense]|uniref:LysM domain-containing protein n=1 Tax=Sesamum angolense TaxID=2727404 RepID=A0AAE1WVJ1_9LAMI|nr:hypothetical protein Sango_1127700 [Sesamum angolense]